jgi:RNA polymerase sigma factor (sigma-70 family)
VGATLEAPVPYLAPSPTRLNGESDDSLVEFVRSGDDRAFEAIYDRYAPGLLSFCTHMLRSREGGEDAVQQTFVSAYRALRAAESQIVLRPWLYAIARNRCISEIRAYRATDPADAELALAADVTDQVWRREELRELFDDIRSLPDDQRAALVLFELGDNSQREIAEILGVQAPKVKALVFQAREALTRFRHARNRSCLEIREEIANVPGRAASRSTLRTHIDRCPSCAAYEDETRRQRAAMAMILPVPALAGLRAAVLGLTAHHGAAAAGAGGAAAVGAGGATAGGVTAGAGGATAGGATAGGAAAAGGAATAGAGTAGAAFAGTGATAGGALAVGGGATAAGSIAGGVTAAGSIAGGAAAAGAVSTGAAAAGGLAAAGAASTAAVAGGSVAAATGLTVLGGFGSHAVAKAITAAAVAIGVAAPHHHGPIQPPTHRLVARTTLPHRTGTLTRQPVTATVPSSTTPSQSPPPSNTTTTPATPGSGASGASGASGTDGSGANAPAQTEATSGSGSSPSGSGSGEPSTPTLNTPAQPAANPDPTQPASDPSSTGPQDPTSTDPTSTDPTSTDPTSTDPTSTDPTSTDPTSTDPTSTDPTSTDPTSTDPTNTDTTGSTTTTTSGTDTTGGTGGTETTAGTDTGDTAS